jgi:anti-sigma regulatory factor (Ser/Thr protein kinase)
MVRCSKPGVQVTFQECHAPLAVDADENELLQALLNVATNSLEATDVGHLTGSCTLTTGVPGRVAQVVIEDSGRGMSPETLARAFEPLFTTKSAQGGSGLGLTLVHRTIQNLQGSVEIASTLGRGTVVTIFLPRSHSVSASSLPPPAPVAATELGSRWTRRWWTSTCPSGRVRSWSSASSDAAPSCRWFHHRSGRRFDSARPARRGTRDAFAKALAARGAR